MGGGGWGWVGWGGRRLKAILIVLSPVCFLNQHYSNQGRDGYTIDGCTDHAEATRDNINQNAQYIGGAAAQAFGLISAEEVARTHQ